MTTDLEALGLAIKRAQYRNHRAMDAALRDIGISLVQWDALRAVDRLPSASSHELALATFQSDQAFGTLSNRLIERGLITRMAGHGRRLEHTLTPSGEAALEDGHQIASGVLEHLFAPLSGAQRDALSEALLALTTDS